MPTGVGRHRVADRRRQNRGRRAKRGGSYRVRSVEAGRRLKRRVAWGVAILAATGLCVGVIWYQRQWLGPAIPVAVGSARGFNVMLITLDTTRADRLGCYGCDAVSTPVLDGLAVGGVRFAHATASTPMTLPSHASIHTGLYPPRHGVRDNGLFRLTERHRTLAERLKASGCATAAFVGSFVLDRRYGLSQGFDVYDDALQDSRRVSGVRYGEPQRPGNLVVDAALKWLDDHHERGGDRPFFAWVHLFDAHTPYLPPEPYATRYREQPYLGEIAFADEQVGRLVAWLRANALLESTLLVVVGDHGESLGEHFEETHSLLLYEATMAVPMIWYAPGVIAEPAVVSDRVVGTVDVTPTILDFLGIDDDGDGAGGASEPGAQATPVATGGGVEPDGVSLLRGHVPAHRAVYIETLMPKLRHGWSALFGLRRVGDKYIEAPAPEYYDLVQDSSELHNAYATSAAAEALRQELAERMAAFEPVDKTGDATVTPDAEALEKLAALGYVADAESPGGAPRDPKVMIRLYQKYQRAVDLIAVGGFEEAITLLQEVVAGSPEDGAAWVSLGLALARAGRVDESLPAVTRAVELQPRERHWVYLARLQLLRGDDAGFEESLKRLEALDPNDGEIAILRGEREMRRKRYAAAAALFKEARRRDPSRQSAAAFAWQGKALVAMGDRKGARTAFEGALSCDPTDVEALEAVVQLEEALGDYAGAVEHARTLCDRRPLVMRHATKLAGLWVKLKRPDEAVATLEAFVARRPDDRKAYANLGKLLVDLGRYAEAVAPLRRALALSSQYTFGQVQLGRALAGQADLSGAIEQFRQVLSRKPGNRQARRLLIRTLTAAGRLGEACEVIEEGGPGRVDLPAIVRDPAMRALVDDPRFDALRQRFGGP